MVERCTLLRCLGGFEMFVAVVLFDVPCRESEMERSWMEGVSTEGRLGFPIACLWL